MRARAEAAIAVRSAQAEAYDESEGPGLMEIRITETFTGDIEGESPVRALQVVRGDKSASSGLRGESGFEGAFGKGCADG